MSFKPKRTTATPLFKQAGILKLSEYINLQNCLFAYDSINRNLPTSLLDDRITFVQTTGNTRDERLNQLVNFRTNTILYGTNTIKARAVKAWNDINIDLHHLKLQHVSKAVCKQRVYEHLLDKYPGNNDINVRNINRINNNIINNNNNNHRVNHNRINNNRNNFQGIQVLRRGGNNYGRLANNWTGQGLVSRWDN